MVSYNKVILFCFIFISISILLYFTILPKDSLTCFSSFTYSTSDNKEVVTIDVDYSINVASFKTLTLSVVGYMSKNDSQLDINRVYEYNVDSYSSDGKLTLMFKNAHYHDDGNNKELGVMIGKLTPANIGNIYKLKIINLKDNLYLITINERSLLTCLKLH